MSAVRSTVEVKYELLSHTTTSRAHPRWKEYGVILACLITLIGVSYLTMYLAWGHLEDDQQDNLDFVMYGPARTQLGLTTIQQRRSELYAKANHDKQQTMTTDTGRSETSSDQSSLLRNPIVKLNPPPDGFKLVCYYALPSSSDPLSFSELMPESLNASLCSHINLAFASISANNSMVPSSHHDIKHYESVVKLKEQNPSLKVLISVNGDMKALVLNHTSRKTFIRSCVSTMKKFNFDGVDIDWEFPTDAWKFVTLLSELREALGTRYLLTVAVAAPQPIVDLSYKINVMSRYVDWVNLMTYDFHHYTKFTPWTGLNAPLYSGQKEQGYLAQLNSNWTALYWESQGMPRNKIVLGIPTYGHTFTLVNEENHDIGAPSSSFADIGVGGFINYPDVCQFLSNGATSISDRASRSPYAFSGQNWISYEDERSVAYKAEFVTLRRYSGAMVWSLNSDDFYGSCYNSGVKFPLTERIKSVLVDDEL